MTTNPPDSAPQDVVEQARTWLRDRRVVDKAIIYTFAKAVLGMQKHIKELTRRDEVLTQNLHWEAERVEAAEAQVIALRAALEKLFYRHPESPPLTDAEYDMIRPLLSAAPPAVPDTTICCFDCGRKYIDGGFQDLILPNDIWRQISPTGDEGGLLCPSCICKRAHDLGVTCTAIFRSGPFVDRERADPNLKGSG